MGVATTRGFEHKHDVSTGGCVAQSRKGRSCTRLSNGSAEIPGRSAFFSQSQLVWVVISPCVINNANYSVVKNRRSGVLSSLWFTSWGSFQPAMVGPADGSRYDVRWLISGRLSFWVLVLAKLGQKIWWRNDHYFCPSTRTFEGFLSPLN